MNTKTDSNENLGRKKCNTNRQRKTVIQLEMHETQVERQVKDMNGTYRLVVWSSGWLVPV